MRPWMRGTKNVSNNQASPQGTPSLAPSRPPRSLRLASERPVHRSYSAPTLQRLATIDEEHSGAGSKAESKADSEQSDFETDESEGSSDELNMTKSEIIKPTH